jgi:hypothetical protein
MKFGSPFRLIFPLDMPKKKKKPKRKSGKGLVGTTINRNTKKGVSGREKQTAQK